MAVYDGVSPVHLREALAGLERQSRMPDEVLLVADGRLTPELDRVIEQVQNAGGLNLRRVDIARRSGAGIARAMGVRVATTDYIAIADADDVSLPFRLEAQAAVLDSGDADAVGAAMHESDADVGTALGVRRLPQSHPEIARLARMNNPVNHPTLMFRRANVLEVGNYRDIPWLEDYDLVVRLLARGHRLHNLPAILVSYRGGAAAQRRRRARSIGRAEWKLQQTLRAEGLISGRRMLANFAVRSAYRLVPDRLALPVYQRLFLTEESSAVTQDRPDYDRHVDMSEVRGPLGEAFATQALTTAGYSEAQAAVLDVLDVGSGYGDTARALATRCRHVTCLEPARELHLKAKARAVLESASNLSFIHGGVEDLEAEDDFDFVILDNVYEHLSAQSEALEVLWKALKPGGSLFLLTPNKLWPIEAHYHLPGLAWLPLPMANAYLRASGRGRDYTDASYAPTYWGLRNAFDAHGGWDYNFTLPGDPTATVAGQPWHYRAGMAAIRRYPSLWAISKALLVVATKRPISP